MGKTTHRHDSQGKTTHRHAVHGMRSLDAGWVFRTGEWPGAVGRGRVGQPDHERTGEPVLSVSEVSGLSHPQALASLTGGHRAITPDALRDRSPRSLSACPLRHECHSMWRTFPVSMRSLERRCVCNPHALASARSPVIQVVTGLVPVTGGCSSAHPTKGPPILHVSSTGTWCVAALSRGNSALIRQPKCPSFRAKSPRNGITEFMNYRGRNTRSARGRPLDRPALDPEIRTTLLSVASLPGLDPVDP